MSEKTVSGMRVLSEAETVLCAGGSLPADVLNILNQTSHLASGLVYDAGEAIGEVLPIVQPPIQWLTGTLTK